MVAATRRAGIAKAMDPSWYLCQHLFISANPNISTPVDHSCAFLGSQCHDELHAALTGTWRSEDPSTMCAKLVFDPIRGRCISAFGFSRANVIGTCLSEIGGDGRRAVEVV